MVDTNEKQWYYKRVHLMDAVKTEGGIRMEYETNELRGEIVAKFGSMEKCGKAIGWSGRKIRDVVTGRQSMTAGDIEQLSSALSVKTVERFMKLFFPNLSI